jgi:hypothetical protein
MYENFNKVTDLHSYKTRKCAFNFFVPLVNSASAATFYFNSIKAWNNLPEVIKSQKRYQRFKMEVKKYFLSLYNTDQ